MTNFSIDWPHGHVTRDGRTARIICTDKKGDFPIVALIDNGSHETSAPFTIQGTLCGNGSSRKADLFNKQPVLRAWVNVYEDEFGGFLYSSKEKADIASSEIRNRIACIPIEYDPSEVG